MDNNYQELTKEQLDLFDKYNLEPNPTAVGLSLNRIEWIILMQIGKHGNEIGKIMGHERLAAAMGNR